MGKSTGLKPQLRCGTPLLLAVLHELPQQFLPLEEQGRVPRVPHRFQGVQVGFLPSTKKRAGKCGSPRQATTLIFPRHF